jgi:glycosyltransferase involved in cell wall biosynthesis
MSGVSVLIPLYNGIEFLEECIQSVLSQTHHHFEILVGVNGHSVDSDVYVQAKTFEQKDSRITVKWYATSGKPETMNEMVHDTHHNIIAILDADDVWLPTKLEKQLKYINDYSVVGTQCNYIINGQVTNAQPAITLGIVRDFFERNNIINSSALIHRCDAAWDNTFLGLEDYNMWISLYSRGRTFYNVPESLVYHRLHNKSAFNGPNANLVPELLHKWKKLLQK